MSASSSTCCAAGSAASRPPAGAPAAAAGVPNRPRTGGRWGRIDLSATIRPRPAAASGKGEGMPVLRARLLLVAALAAAPLLLGATPAAAEGTRAEVNDYLDEVADRIAKPGVYVDPAVLEDDELTVGQVTALTRQARKAPGPLRIVVLPVESLTVDEGGRTAADLAYRPSQLVRRSTAGSTARAPTPCWWSRPARSRASRSTRRSGRAAGRRTTSATPPTGRCAAAPPTTPRCCAGSSGRPTTDSRAARRREGPGRRRVPRRCRRGRRRPRPAPRARAAGRSRRSCRWPRGCSGSARGPASGAAAAAPTSSTTRAPRR